MPRRCLHFILCGECVCCFIELDHDCRQVLACRAASFSERASGESVKASRLTETCFSASVLLCFPFGRQLYKLESISSNYRNRKRTLEQKMRDAFEEKIRRMYQSELNTATEKYHIKVDEINERASRADIHTALIANGIIDIRRG